MKIKSKKVLTFILLGALFWGSGYFFGSKKDVIFTKINLLTNYKRPKDLRKVNFEGQDAYFKSSSKKNMPLVVNLHQWSGDYKSTDKLASSILDMDWNYVFPDFQGENNNPSAGGSDKVVDDIDKAIEYSIKSGNVDEDNIFIVGESGGGHAALVSLMKSKYSVNSYIAWVPITDLTSWYNSSSGRNLKYADDIMAVTDSKNSLNIEEANKRSPMYMDIPTERFKKSKVKIFAGVHDGYDGSVPITQSLKFYNRLAKEQNGELVTQGEMLDLLENRHGEKVGEIGDRDVYLEKKSGNLELYVFDGGHEMLVEYTSKLLTSLVK